MSAKTILVVEDEASIAEVVSLYLKRAGYNVQIASDGKKAMSIFERQTPDFVILDLMLPEVTVFPSPAGCVTVPMCRSSC